MCSIVFLVNFSRMVFAPLLQPAAGDFGVSAASLGVVTSAAWLGSAAPRLPTGYLLTRVPRHYVVLATGSSLVVTAGLTAFAGSIAQLTAGAFLMGLSSGMYFIAANPLLSELFPERLGRILGVHGMSSQLAAVTAPLVLSAVLLVGEWRQTFLLIAAVAAIATVLFFVFARRTALPRAGEQDRSLLAAGRAQWPIILTGIITMGAAGFLWNGLFNLYGDYLEVAKGIDPSTGRLLLSVMFAAGLPAFFITGRLADRVALVPLLLSIIGAFTASVFALTLVDGVIPIALLSIIVGYAFHGLIPATDTYLLGSLPDRHRGSAYALYSAAMMVMIALGSGTIGSLVTTGISYTDAFRGVSLIVGGILIGLIALFRHGSLPTGGRPDQHISK